jgi:hypothetical protein
LQAAAIEDVLEFTATRIYPSAAFLFSEMLPVCFRPAFDGIGEMWFAATVVKKRSVMDDGGTGGLLGASSIFN